MLVERERTKISEEIEPQRWSQCRDKRRGLRVSYVTAFFRDALIFRGFMCVLSYFFLVLSFLHQYDGFISKYCIQVSKISYYNESFEMVKKIIVFCSFRYEWLKVVANGIRLRAVVKFRWLMKYRPCFILQIHSEITLLVVFIIEEKFRVIFRWILNWVKNVRPLPYRSPREDW